MSRQTRSSRQAFTDYQDALRETRGEPIGRAHSSAEPSKAPRVRSTGTLIREFIRLLGRERRSVAFALCSLTAATVLALIPPAATKAIVDYVLTDHPIPDSWRAWFDLPTDRRDLLVVIVSTVVVISLVKILVTMSGRWTATRSTKRLQMTVRKHVFEHAVRLPLNRVYEIKSGGVASVLREDAGAVGELIFGMLYNPWLAVVQLVGSLLVLAWVDWLLLVGACVLIPMVFLTHRTWIRRIRPQYRRIRKQRETVDGQATEVFGGMRVVRAFSGQRRESGRFTRGIHLMGRQELLVWWWSRGIEIVWEALIPLASAALMFYGGLQVLQGTLTMGDLMMFLAYLLMLLEPLGVLAQSATAFQNSLSGLDRILDLLEEPRELSTSPNAVTVSKSTVTGRLDFRGVSFEYPGAADYALRDVNLEVEPGQTVALVGPSGAGKTTLCNLVARFYDPTDGSILLDNRDLRDIEIDSFRSLLGVVEQDVFLFDGTIADNIGYAVRNATDADIRRAADIANASEFIDRLPEGFDSIIGERGVKLSGGQRQRLAIARAVLADPAILILDEATSNLDTESERLIQQSLSTLMQARTCFVIAHRLSTITRADRIVVIEDGGIVESGTHDSLLAAGGRYQTMVELQVANADDVIELDAAI